MINRLVDVSFLVFPFAASNESQFIEVLLTVACCFSDNLKTLMSSDLPENMEIVNQFYMGLNFIVRYSVGERRIKNSVKKRGPAFWVRYGKTFFNNIY
jgi:hypothetical protein